jgi:hypothetical protein
MERIKKTKCCWMKQKENLKKEEENLKKEEKT